MINHLILHIMDCPAQLCLLADQEMDLQHEGTLDFVERHLQRLQRENRSQKGRFNQDSGFKQALDQYCQGQRDFVDFSRVVADVLYNQLSRAEKLASLDFLVVDYSVAEKYYIGLLLLDYRRGFIHQVDNGPQGLVNSIVEHNAILPNSNQKIAAYALVDKESRQILFDDKLLTIDGVELSVLADKVLDCSAEMSSKEALKAVSDIATQVAESYGENAAVVLSQAKNYIVENAEVSELLSLEELGKELFAAAPDQQRSYASLMEEAQLPQEVEISKSLAVKTGRSHKIKTDTGIELSFPVEYFSNPDFIEFINNPDGTIAIELKNIGKITNK